MLKRLTIQNYALIDELEMEPHAGLNIITGETGAGKSIMLGAVGLLVGERSDSRVLLNTEQKCVVEGTFDLSTYRLKPLFDEADLDYDDECIIRREINPGGKSRAFVNDTPVGLQILKDLGEKLLDVHSQHETLQLREKVYQLSVLDAYAAHEALLEKYAASFKTYSAARTRLAELQSLHNQGNEEADYKQYLLQELEQAQLDDLNQEALEQELEVLENAEDIKLKLGQSLQMIEGEEVSIQQLLTEVRALMSSIAKFSDDLGKLDARIESQWHEWQDLSRELAHRMELTEYNPERIAELKDRLDLLYRLQKKHNVLVVDQLIELRDRLSRELTQTQNLDKEIAQAKKNLETAEKSMNEAGLLLRESRQLAAYDLAAEIEKIIHKIGIENGRVEIQITPSSPTPKGMDTVDIRFSANKGIAPQEVSQVASGGEFSRLIFAIKYLIADKTAMPTVIFDEIDTGVSGEVALQMVAMMQSMAKKHQVISISHLPQFAAGGQAHYFVYKDHSMDRSVSRIRKLEANDRVAEIAKMIGGNQPSESAYSSARELLGIR